MPTTPSSGTTVVSDTGTDATYVYCVVKSPDAERSGGAGGRVPKLGRAPPGLWGTRGPRMLDAGDGYRLVVATAPLSLYAAGALEAKLGDLDWLAERATEHEAVVEHATKLGSVVPMKLFTLFGSDERALSHVRKMKRSLEPVVARIAGCEEWALRILAPAGAAHAGSASGPVERRRRPKDTVDGTSFARHKKVLADERREAGAPGAAAIDELYERLANNVRDAKRRAPRESELTAGQVLDAAFLVPRESVKKVKAIVAASARSLVDDGLCVSLSGPWPAYSFIGSR